MTALMWNVQQASRLFVPKQSVRLEFLFLGQPLARQREEEEEEDRALVLYERQREQIDDYECRSCFPVRCESLREVGRPNFSESSSVE